MKILVIGYGLIGGSIACALKLNSNHQVYVYDKNKHATKSVLKEKSYWYDFSVVEKEALIETLVAADLIIVATPVSAVKGVAALIRLSRTKAFITDVCSLKEVVIQDFKDELSTEQFKNYVPTHPLAGSEKSGLSHSNPNMFFEKDVCVCYSKDINLLAYRTVTALWESNFKAIVKSISPKDHDILMAQTSHLIHLLSFGIAPKIPLTFNVPSTQDLTRLSRSHKGLWNEIFKGNKENLISSIDSLQLFLQSAKENLEQDNDVIG